MTQTLSENRYSRMIDETLYNSIVHIEDERGYIMLIDFFKYNQYKWYQQQPVESRALMFREALVDHEGQEENANAGRDGDSFDATMWADCLAPAAQTTRLKDEATDRRTS